MKTTLYKKTKSKKIQQWTIWQENNKILVEHGYTNGKKQVSEKLSTSKNVGKSNETSPDEQAALEIQSLIKKQLDKGYKTSETLAENETVLLPMLAHEFGERKHNIAYPCCVQPKLDGVRSLVLDSKIFISRKGKTYNVPHLLDQIKELNIDNNIVLDGEIYSHGENLQKIGSWVKKQQPNTMRLEYHIYDCYVKNAGDEIFVERWKRIQALQKIITEKRLNNIKIVDTKIAASEEEVYELHDLFLSQKYEGSIIRDAGLKYALNVRSEQLLKLKNFTDEEFEITGCKEGKGKWVGSAIFICKTKEGKPFDAVSPGTLKDKQEFFKNQKQYIGKLLKVKYFDKTEENKPRFPVGICVRLEED